MPDEPKPEEAPASTKTPGLAGTRLSEDFESVYANQSNFEISEFDLKAIFGQLDQKHGPAFIEWHTAITLPWVQAKIFCYFLQLNIAFYELREGKIKIPQTVMPPEPKPLTGDAANDPNAQAFLAIMTKLRESLLP